MRPDERTSRMSRARIPRLLLRLDFLLQFCALSVALGLLWPSHAAAQTAVEESATAPVGTGEQRAARAYDAARANPLELEAFLRRMPKGADLHYHEFGGIYAETWIQENAEDGMCVDLSTYAIVPPQPACGAGQVAAAQAMVGPESARRAGRCVFDAQLRARHRARAATISFSETFDKFRNHQPSPRRRMAGRNRFARRGAERAVPGNHG